jgi:hypothetical protein
MEAAPPRGRPEFDPNHIVVHHLWFNQNAESTKSLDQSDHRKPPGTRVARGENGRQEGEIPGEDEFQVGSLSTVSGGHREEDFEARRWSLRLCRRISVARGPVVWRWGRGSGLTGWVEELQFFFFFSYIFFHEFGVFNIYCLGIIVPLVPGVGLNYKSFIVVQKVYGGSMW